MSRKIAGIVGGTKRVNFRAAELEQTVVAKVVMTERAGYEFGAWAQGQGVETQRECRQDGQ